MKQLAINFALRVRECFHIVVTREQRTFPFTPPEAVGNGFKIKCLSLLVLARRDEAISVCENVCSNTWLLTGLVDAFILLDLDYPGVTRSGVTHLRLFRNTYFGSFMLLMSLCMFLSSTRYDSRPRLHFFGEAKQIISCNLSFNFSHLLLYNG